MTTKVTIIASEGSKLVKIFTSRNGENTITRLDPMNNEKYEIYLHGDIVLHVAEDNP